MAEEGISEFEGTTVQTSQTEKQREQKLNIYIFKNYDIIAKATICIMEIPETEERQKGKINIQSNSD